MNYISLTDKQLEEVYRVNGINYKSFKGHVLYIGLGSAYLQRKQPKGVKSTTIEISQEIVDEHWHKSYGKLIVGDILSFTPVQKFDFIVADIWYTPQEFKDGFEQVKTHCLPLLKKGGSFLYCKTLEG